MGNSKSSLVSEKKKKNYSGGILHPEERVFLLQKICIGAKRGGSVPRRKKRGGVHAHEPAQKKKNMGFTVETNDKEGGESFFWGGGKAPGPARVQGTVPRCKKTGH